ncbi:MAG: SDR family NAD(P)-dependent oxidoreductase [Comamonadaceae bacterium]|nr:SDR family NAD(P)-dependent oxidoreductase [Comamonadaceae bacterium]
MQRMNGRTAIITGATSGMGRAAALLFAREGASIVASGRDEARGRSLSARSLPRAAGPSSLPGDVSLPDTNARARRAVLPRVRTASIRSSPSPGCSASVPSPMCRPTRGGRPWP